MKNKQTFTKQKYLAYLKSPKWKEKRQQCFKIHGTLCVSCGERAIHIHHKTYINFTRENVKKDLIPLCVDCHHLIHEVSKEKKCNVFQATNIVLGLNDPQPKYQKKGKHKNHRKRLRQRKTIAVNKKKKPKTIISGYSKQKKETLFNLCRFYEKGKITEEEYNTKRNKLLN